MVGFVVGTAVVVAIADNYTDQHQGQVVAAVVVVVEVAYQMDRWKLGEPQVLQG